ncbi:MAG: pyridoxamine 5'-phosphate oxidase family protein [Halobellus sp.]|uniref:pyridoxamine 5'-phosphate oxidase family protein n=1 Tax=Halobellus sp. TaxID=1979212 RepID=UPI0035D490EB
MSSPRETLQGKQLTETAVDEFLETKGFGVLSLAANGVPYALPMSFGYDGSKRLYVVFLGHSEEWKKMTYADATDAATFLTFDVESAETWRSVIVAGSFERIDYEQWDTAREAMAGNAFRPDLLVDDVNVQENPQVWVLEAKEKSGRAIGTM